MADRPEITLEGQQSLLRKLDRLDRNLARKIVRQASRAAARPVQAAAKRYAPEDEGNLKRQIKIRAQKRSRTRRYSGVTVGVDNTRSAVDVFYAGFQEYGTQYIEGQLFMHNAIESKSRTAQTIMARFIRRGIRDSMA